MVNKYELIIQIAKKFNATLDKDIKPFIHIYDLEHILLEALEGYTLIDTKKLRDKLVVVERPLPKSAELEETHTRFETSVKLTMMADKHELNNPEFIKYINEYSKTAFIETLDEQSELTKTVDENAEKYIKLMKLLEDRGIETYDKAKAYFDRLDAEEDWRMNEALDEYYNGPRHRDEREFY